MSVLDVITRLHWLIALVVTIWSLQIVNMATGYKLNPLLGLRPRRKDGLAGVLFMPVLHGNFSHALANTYPLVTLGTLMGYSSQPQLAFASLLIVLGGGFGVWLFARRALHVGASGLIFGWFGYLLARGYVDANLQTMAIAAGVALTYGTMIFGILPRDGRISWEAHLFGALAGVASAYVLHA